MTKPHKTKKAPAPRQKARKAPAPIVLNIDPNAINAIVDYQYANEDRVNDSLAAMFANPMMSGVMPDFAGRMLTFSVYKAAEHVLRIEHSAQMYPGNPMNDVPRARLQYVKALTSARKTLGANFDALYAQTLLENNACARENLDRSNGLLYCYVVPRFNDDGTHDPVGPRDLPWAQVARP